MGMIGDLIDIIDWLLKSFKTFFPSNFNRYDFGSSGNDRNFVNFMNKKLTFLGFLNNKNKINYDNYISYFYFLKEINLLRNFSITTSINDLKLEGTIIFPILRNKNNNKVIIMCHGVTNNRWSNFYVIHLAIQRGYKVVIYDARNHGSSEKNPTTLGQSEAFDLNDIINWVNCNYNVQKIGIYGFSMGASTCIFWLNYFFKSLSENKVKMIVCDSVFDEFEVQKKNILGSGLLWYIKNFFLEKGIKKRLGTNFNKLANISPVFNIPKENVIPILFLHGMKDQFINWRSSLNIFNKLRKNGNSDKLSIYFCKFSDHGELPVFSDFIPNSLYCYKEKKNTKHSFSSLFFTYLEKNL